MRWVRESQEYTASSFVGWRRVLRGSSIDVRIHATEAASPAAVQGPRVVMAVMVSAIWWFPCVRIYPAGRSNFPARFRWGVSTQGRVQSVPELLAADSTDWLVLVARGVISCTACTVATAWLSCSFIILDSVLRGLVAASVMMVVVRWWRVLLGGLAWAVSWARRALRWGTWWPTPVVHLTGVGWLVVPHKLSTWDSWLLGMHGARWSTHNPKAKKLIWI